MVERYKMHSTSRQSAVVEGRVLSCTATTRLFLLPEIVRNPKHSEAKVKVTLVHQRKALSGAWQNEPSPPLSALKAGEARKLILDCEQTLNLNKELKNLYAIGDEVGVRPGDARLVVAPETEVIITDQNRANIIKSLLSKGYSDDVWDTLVKTQPDLATRLSYARIHAERTSALATFKTNLKLAEGETWWQEFFERNTWIFGYGLNYKILKTVQSQPRYGGSALDGRGMQKGDFLQRTEAETKFTVLVEIKRPDTQLLGNDVYRNGACELGKELTGGVSQMQANCNKWEKEGSQTENNKEALLKEKIFTVQPKGILVIGQTRQLDKISKRNTFELFRRNVVNPEIITFDELYERAKYIVERTGDSILAGESNATSASEPSVDDIPF